MRFAVALLAVLAPTSVTAEPSLVKGKNRKQLERVVARDVAIDLSKQSPPSPYTGEPVPVKPTPKPVFDTIPIVDKHYGWGHGHFPRAYKTPVTFLPFASEPTVEPGEIDRVVRARAGLFRACYQKELNRKPHLAGTIVLRFVIEPDGAVGTASVKQTTMGDAEVDSCVLAQIKRLAFPARTRVIVTYPFRFGSE